MEPERQRQVIIGIKRLVATMSELLNTYFAEGEHGTVDLITFILSTHVSSIFTCLEMAKMNVRNDDFTEQIDKLMEALRSSLSSTIGEMLPVTEQIQ